VLVIPLVLMLVTRLDLLLGCLLANSLESELACL
jgi:hypothetical protein